MSFSLSDYAMATRQPTNLSYPRRDVAVRDRTNLKIRSSKLNTCVHGTFLFLAFLGP